MPENSRTVRAPKRATESAPARSRVLSWHRIGRAALFAVAGVLPWFFLPLTPAPAASARFFLAALAATVGLVALLADTVERRRLTYPGTLAGVGVLAVVVATALSAIFSMAPGASLFGYLTIPDSLAHVLVAAVLFVLSAAFLTRAQDYFRLLAAFVGGAGFASLLGILGLLGVPYLAAFAPAYVSELGFVAVLALGLACLVPVADLGSRAKGFVLGSAALALVALVLMNFQILWIALALIALFCAAAGFMKRASIALPLGLSVIALLFVLIGTRLPSFTAGSVELRPSLGVTASTATHDASARTALIGRGPGTFPYAFDLARPQEGNETPFWSVRFMQGSSFLATIPVTLGIVGSLAWLLLLVAAARLALRRMDEPGVPFVALAVILTGLGLLAYPGSFIELAFGGIALGALVGLTGGRREVSFPARSSWPLFAVFLLLIVFTAGSLAGMYLVGQRYVAAAYFARGSESIAAGNTERGLGQIARALSLDDSDVYQRGFSQALLVRFREQLASSTDARAQEEALKGIVQAATAATQTNPADTANWANLGGIYEGLTPFIEGMDAQAIAAYDVAAERDPKSPAWPLARARTYGALAQFQASRQQPNADAYAKAQDEIAKALELKGDFVEARFLSAQLHLGQGNADQALARVQEIRDIAGNDANLAFQTGLLLYQAGRYADARVDFEHAVSLSGTYADARYFLGLTFAQLGQREQALAQFEVLKGTNPDNKEIPVILDNLRAGRPVLEGVAGGATSSTAPASEAPTTTTSL